MDCFMSNSSIVKSSTGQWLITLHISQLHGPFHFIAVIMFLWEISLLGVKPKDTKDDHFHLWTFFIKALGKKLEMAPTFCLKQYLK